jgi:hypothetical protein
LGGLWPAIVAAVPALASAARVSRLSTSAGLSDSRNGLKFEGSGGQHIYVPVQDGADIPRFLEALYQRVWLAGFGWGVPSRSGAFFERSLVDRSVGAPQRLVFEGAPTLQRPLCQDKAARTPTVVDGEVIDTRVVCPDLTVEERATLATLLTAERERLKLELDRIRAAFIDEHVAKIVKRTGATPEAARKTVESFCAGVLTDDVELPFDRREFAGKTVAHVLADPDKFVGATLADPVEGVP